MKKVKVKVVIGSNYGDECKGLATAYFAKEYTPCLNVLFNGGCQRGHTVEMTNGTRHVFHHLGSGTFYGAYTYFDQDFIVNPIIFNVEYQEIREMGIVPCCYVSPNCRVSTPYDAFINQIVEDSRGDSRHGSCGFGIWETQKRHENGKYALTFKELTSKTDDEIIQYLSDIATDYFPKRLEEYGIKDIPEIYRVLINSKNLHFHFLCDVRAMQSVVEICEFDKLFPYFNTIVFEGAQGLALDENNKENYPNVTASKTTSCVPVERVKNYDCDIEICYVTRSYFTRHGAGNFPTECDKEKINVSIEDKTNVYNEYQQSIRYGLFSNKEFKWRVIQDFHNSWGIKPDITCSIFITHLNYTNNEIAGDTTIDELSKDFDKVYLSSTKYVNDIKVMK